MAISKEKILNLNMKSLTCEQASIYFQQCCEHGWLEQAKYLVNKDRKSNDEAHADISCFNNEPMRRACKAGHLEIVKYLMNNKEHAWAVDINADKNLGFDYAVAAAKQDIVDYLLFDHELVSQNRQYIINRKPRHYWADLAFSQRYGDISTSWISYCLSRAWSDAQEHMENLKKSKGYAIFNNEDINIETSYGYLRDMYQKDDFSLSVFHACFRRAFYFRDDVFFQIIELVVQEIYKKSPTLLVNMKKSAKEIKTEFAGMKTEAEFLELNINIILEKQHVENSLQSFDTGVVCQTQASKQSRVHKI